jgi:hypothetical protein
MTMFLRHQLVKAFIRVGWAFKNPRLKQTNPETKYASTAIVIRQRPPPGNKAAPVTRYVKAACSMLPLVKGAASIIINIH